MVDSSQSWMKCCRLCLCADACIHLQNVYEEVRYDEVVQMLNIETESAIPCRIPEKICSECAVNLQQFHKFRSKCIQANKRLMNLSASTQKRIENNVQRSANCVVKSNVADVETEAKREGMHGIDMLDTDENATGNGVTETTDNNTEEDVLEEYLMEDDDANELLQLSSDDAASPTPSIYEDFVELMDDDDETHNASLQLRLTRQQPSSNGAPFICDQCGRSFGRRFILQQHQNTHSDVKRFECHLCGVRFTRSSHMELHMRIHQKIRPYVCSKCGRKFTKNGDLLRHQHTHSDVRKYQCNECPKTCKRLTDLQVHMQTHSGRRPYVCQIQGCDKSYTSHSSIKKHRLKCHPTLTASNNQASEDIANIPKED